MQNFQAQGLRRLGALPPDPQPPTAEGFAPRPTLANDGYAPNPQNRPPWRISGYAPDHTNHTLHSFFFKLSVQQIHTSLIMQYWQR